MANKLTISPVVTFIGDGSSTTLVFSLDDLRLAGNDIASGVKVSAVKANSFNGGNTPSFTGSVDSTGTVITLTLSVAPTNNTIFSGGVDLYL